MIPKKIKPSKFWVPQPGPQWEATFCPVDEIFFGGSRGGGKTDAVVGRNVIGMENYEDDWSAIVIRRKYKDFAEIRRRFDQIIRQGFPAERMGGDRDINYIRHKEGGQVTLAAVKELRMADDWWGIQFNSISIDEGPTFPFIASLVDKMKGSNRSPAGVPCNMFITGNPGGPGTGQIKTMFVDPVPEGSVNRIKLPDFPAGVKVPEQFKGRNYFTRIFIRSDLADNKVLVDGDPTYFRRLLSIQDAEQRKAWLEGDWNVVIGQAFNLGRQHIIDPIWPVPDGAPIYMTFDWGYGHPFSVGWWWVDAEGRIIRFAEWYGWDGVTPNVGLRITDPQIAEGIIDREQRMRIHSRNITRLAGHDCFNKKPDYKGGGQGPSTAEEFSAYNLHLIPADPSKELKIRQFRNRLYAPKGQAPMMLIYKTCVQFLRVIPTLVTDELTGEYLESGQELHCVSGDTTVCTDSGHVPIRDLCGKSGTVLTSGGYWSEFSNCKLYKKNAEMVIVEFADGQFVKCTPDHKFLTKSGWREAISLTDEECHISIPRNTKGGMLCGSKLFQEINNALTEKSIITLYETSNDFIELCGSTITGQFRKVFAFITSTGIILTTRSKISESLKVPGTIPCTASGMSTPTGGQQCVMVPPSGMGVLKELNGIRSNTRRTARKLFRIPRYHQLASFVGKLIQDSNTLNSVPGNASSGRGLSGQGNLAPVGFVERSFSGSERLALSLARQSSHGKLVKVKTVKQSIPEAAYCLDVAHTNSFGVHSGIQIHNCFDDAAQICMARPMTMELHGGHATHHFSQSELDYMRVRGETGRIAEYEESIARAADFELPDEADSFNIEY